MNNDPQTDTQPNTQVDNRRVINLPIVYELATPEEVAMYNRVDAETKTAESNYLRSLIESGTITEEEAVSYVKFQTALSRSLPFLLDTFVDALRNSKLLEDAQKLADGKIATINGTKSKIIKP